jgi:hypothetical protein
LQSDISAVLTALLSPQVTLLQSYIAAFLTALLSPQVTLLQSDRAAVPTVLLSPLSIPWGLAGGFPGPRVVDGLHLNRRELAARCNLVEDGLTRNEVALVEGVLVQKHRCHEWKRLVRSVDVRTSSIHGDCGSKCRNPGSGGCYGLYLPSTFSVGSALPSTFRWDQSPWNSRRSCEAVRTPWCAAAVETARLSARLPARSTLSGAPPQSKPLGCQAPQPRGGGLRRTVYPPPIRRDQGPWTARPVTRARGVLKTWWC